MGTGEDAAVLNNSNNDNRHLFLQYKNEPSIENRNRVVNAYLYLAEIISKKFINRGMDYDDIYQVACIALIKAVERFDMDKGVKFVSYATPTIIGEIKRFFRDKGSIIRIPRRIYEIYQKINHACEHLTHELHRKPKVDEIASFLNISEENVLEIVEWWDARNIQSFDRNVFEDNDNNLYEAIGENDSDFERIKNRDFLKKSMDRFNEVEKKLIKMRYFNSKTQKEIANELGVSQMYVSRLERKVLEKFRKIINS